MESIKEMRIRITVNGESFVMEHVPVHRTLLQLIREDLGLTGTKEGCGEGDCGACTVILEGKAVNSCLVLAVEADGRQITTVEGLARHGELHPLQQAFVDEGAVQCGYCTPGMLLSAKALIDETPSPTEAEISQAIAGNLCRCTGYTRIVSAISKAAQAATTAQDNKSATQ